MNRRDFLRTAGAASAAVACSPGAIVAARTDAPRSRKFEVTTRVEVLEASGVSRVWVPTPLVASTPYQTLPDNRLTADGGTATLVTLDRRDGLAVVFASFPAGVKPVVTVTSRVATRDVAVDLTAPRRARREDRAVLDHFLRPTRLIPTDGIVKRTADEITRGRTTPLDQARAIYGWIVEHTQRNPKTRGCGLGNIRYMLESGDLSGKCADLNALFVGLARAAGLPARDVYGIRTLKSELGYRSLGVSSETITRAQHCRAEVYLDDHGWVPVDPADVRKVVLEEPPGDRRLDDDLVRRTRERLFGAWEMNWMAYNFAHDVRLPDSHGDPVPFLMYPQAETEEGWVDSLDPERFRYDITAREVGRSMQP